MSSSIQFVGHVVVTPPLDEAAKSDVHRLRSGAGAGTGSMASIRRGGRGRSPWVPCAQGCCLTVADRASATPAEATAWLGRLVDVLGGRVTAGEPGRAGTALRHSLRGMVVGCRVEDGALFSVAVHGRRVTGRQLRAGGHARGRSRPWVVSGASPHGSGALRRAVVTRVRRRTPSEARAAVIDLARRRARAARP